VGSIIATGSLLWSIAFVTFGIVYVYRARVEERLMMHKFPEQYPEYKKSSKMLVPLIF